MSIFRDTFSTQVSGSLAARQNAMTDRTADTIQYLNSRNSWIRMVSSVNVGGSNNSARLNILQGGTLGPLDSLKSGVGDKSQLKAYSNQTPSNLKTINSYRLGIRPMPGITSIDVKSKSAYGSLREVVVHFQCWDIKQLEELEKLYMRPGYTVLVEWGWYPYLDNKGKLYTSPPKHYDILNKKEIELSVIAKGLYDQSLLSGGNYDATFGYIKNYQWSARPDGGYDCQTTIISTGEIIESLKVNYVRPDLLNYKVYDASSIGSGYLNPEFTDQGTAPSTNFVTSYEKNTLAGVWTELYYKLADPVTKFSSNGIFETIAASRGIDRNKLFHYFTDFNFNNLINEGKNVSVAPLADNRQMYITLDVALEFINRYVTIKSNGEPLVKLSLTTSNITNAKSEALLCLAHPLQVSIDPSVCLIKSPLWYDTSNPQNIVVASKTKAVTSLTDTAKSIYDDLSVASTGGGTKDAKFLSAIQQIDSLLLFEAVEDLLSKTPIEGSTTIAALIKAEYGDGFDDSEYVRKFEESLKKIPTLTINVTYTAKTSRSSGPYQGFNDIVITKTSGSSTSTTVAISAGLPNALDAVKILNTLPLDYFYKDDPDNELGIIRNIYVNLDFLYKTAIDQNIESQDHKEKNEISLYKYVKSVMTEINSSLGSMNNFEVHVDPIDNNTARVIDINYTSPTTTTNLFELQVHNLNSVVRNYSLQSQIFPEQSSMIAIGSQVKGGQLGIQNNTMIDFNNDLEDRIIPKKEFPQKDDWNTSKSNITGASLANIILLFSTFWPGSKGDTAALYASSKNSLRDIIVYFQTIVKSSSSNKSIIPIKFSFEMDGIGGLVIGHLFKVNKDILPKGYNDAKLAQTITGISHTVGNSDWTTKIDALNIILEDPTTPKPKFSTSIDLKKVVQDALDSLNNSKAYDASTLLDAVKIIGGVFSDIFLNTKNRFLYKGFTAIKMSPVIKEYQTALKKGKAASIPRGLQILMEAQAVSEGFKPGTKTYTHKNPGNVDPVDPPLSDGYKFTDFKTLEEGIYAQFERVLAPVWGLSSYRKYYNNGYSLYTYLATYAPEFVNGVATGNDTTRYTNEVIGYFKSVYNISISSNTTLQQIYDLKI